MPVAYRLSTRARPGQAGGVPTLDAAQRSVVEHGGGPLLVLAGPGTGKTTTLVEAVVDRVQRRGLDPEQVLVLTFSRQAAAQLRDRITARLRRTTAHPMCSTFHAFSYAVVRAGQPADLYANPLRVLSSPEQDVRLRELLTSSREVGPAHWPDSLGAALGTRGMAREVRSVLARARALAMSPADLAAAGESAGRPEWSALGRFMEEYLQVMDFEGALDYGELVHRATLLAESADLGPELRGRFAAVFVDEFQDTDPGQVRLLQALAGGGRDLVVVGDPDQSIYAFRGAEVRGILDFPDTFRTRDGQPAPVIPLAVTRRFGPRLLAVSRRVAAGIGAGGAIGADALRVFRNPTPERGGVDGGRAEVLLCSSPSAQAEQIADLVRRAHLEDSVPWAEIAVLVRSGTASIPGLRRALVAAGVPVTVSGDEVPLRAEPAVGALLDALSAAVDPAEMSAATAQALLMGPLGGLDAPRLRRLGRLLRRLWQVEHAGEAIPPSADLIRGALADPLVLADPMGAVEGLADAEERGAVADIAAGDAAAAGCRRLADLLGGAHRALAAGESAEQVLWSIWQGTSWPRRLLAAVEHGGEQGRSAHRDLDSVCALFDLAAQAEEKRAHTGVAPFLEEVRAQQIPADDRRSGAVTPDAVRLLTAHRAKGLEWGLVVVAGVQEGSWPDIRRRGTLLRADRLGPDGETDPATSGALLAEERRLFYVAVTRARKRLVVTAVDSGDPDGDRPSRFLDVLGVPLRRLPGRPARPLSVAGLVAALRRTVCDPEASEGLRRAAAGRLARLASEPGPAGPLARAADPAAWWGLRDPSASESPVRAVDEPLGLSASAVDGLLTCPLRWFLAHEAGGETARAASNAVGQVVHAIADRLAGMPEASEQQLLALVDSVWEQIRFDTGWIADREHAAVADAVRLLLAWQHAPRRRTPEGSEREFGVSLGLPDGDSVALRGRVDRLERDSDGALHVVDFKTTKNPPSGPAVAADPQLGVYQAAVEAGAFGSARSGGAELVQLRASKGGLPKVQAQPPQLPDESGLRPVDRQRIQAAAALRAELFPAKSNPYCTRCEFRSGCPVQLAAPTVLS